MTDEQLRELACLVADEIEARRTLPQIVTAKQLAEVLGVSPAVVYANKERLGVIRLGNGPKAPLRFPLDAEAISLWQAQSRLPAPQKAPALRRVRSRSDSTEVPLIDYVPLADA